MQKLIHGFTTIFLSVTGNLVDLAYAEIESKSFSEVRADFVVSYCKNFQFTLISDLNPYGSSVFISGMCMLLVSCCAISRKLCLGFYSIANLTL